MLEGMLDALEWMLLACLWAPPLIVLHELGHALVALLLTDGEVSIELDGGGIGGGRANYEPARLRGSRDEALIAAAGPAVTLVCAAVLWMVVLEDGLLGGPELLEAGAVSATLMFITSALPIRYGIGLGSGESDGRVIWRVLTGGPPGGHAREARRAEKPERAARPVFVVLLALAGLLALLADPVLAVGLVALFGGALLLQRLEARG